MTASNAIGEIARSLPRAGKRWKRWTPEDQGRLEAAYRSDGMAGAWAAFPDRERSAVRARVWKSRLCANPFSGPNYHHWSPAELGRLEAAYVRGGVPAAIAEFPKHKPNSIRSILSNYKIAAKYREIRDKAKILADLESDPEPETRAMRACLRCDCLFSSAGAHNRICPRCAQINAGKVEINETAGMLEEFCE